MAKQQKSHAEKVVAAVGKRPQTATQIGQKLGFKGHQGVAKDLGAAVRAGQVKRTDKGYVKP